MIGIVDYGLGNVRAFENTYRRLGIPAKPICNAAELVTVDKLILPGVGAFDWAMQRLEHSGMLDALNSRVKRDGVPVLGICVGMQIMADSSEEGTKRGLGWVPGRVLRFQDKWFRDRTHLPHMGWNTVKPCADLELFAGLDNAQFYFLHSYFFSAENTEHVAAKTMYGVEFASVIRSGNIWATQFHPEKSHDWGVNLLRNFSRL